MIPAWTVAEPVVTADRDEWLAARRTRLTSTDVARAMTPAGRALVVQEKLFGIERPDNRHFSYGRDRESDIARQAEKQFGLMPNSYLWDGNGLAATPDAVSAVSPELGEWKTSVKPLPKTVPRMYRDQIFVAQHVFGAQRTLLGWEHHINGVPADLCPTWLWIERDQDRINELLAVANELAEFLEMERLTLAY